MLHNFAIFLHSRRKTNQWHIYHSPRNRTLIDYREREKEKERHLKSTNRRAYNQAYNRRAYNRVIKCTYRSQN